MNIKEKVGASGLRRTATEVKQYRSRVRVLTGFVAFAIVAVAVLYIGSVLYSRYGSFTVSVNKFDSVNFGLSLCETPDFKRPTMRLNAKANEDVTNISVRSLPADLDMINGSHNGDNYLAYTYYCKNVGELTIDAEYRMYIANMTKGAEEAARVRLYVDGEYKDYARTRNDGGGAEPGTVEFLDAMNIVKGPMYNFKPGDMMKFTVVIWLEGDDPECVDAIIGGQFKVDMQIEAISVDDKKV